MGVKVFELDEKGDPDAPPGSKPWAIYFVNQTKIVRNQLNNDVERLQNLIDKLQRNEAWKALGFPSFSMLAATKIGLEPEEIERIGNASKGSKIGDVIPPLRDKAGRPDNDSKNENRIIVRGGTNSEYRIAKLKRDAPEFAERFEAGEFPNVREAERAAGFPVPPKLTPLERVLRAFERLNTNDKIEFFRRVGE